MVTTTAHSVGKIVIERLGEGESENESERGLSGRWKEVNIPFMNENLAVVGVDEEGSETVSPCLFVLIWASDADFICQGAGDGSRFDLPAGCFNW